jgi:DUF4097 and DUF4098 domain-containing protein YvlB
MDLTTTYTILLQSEGGEQQMSTIRKSLTPAVLTVLLLAAVSFAGTRDKTVWTFDGKQSVELETVSGDCIIKQGTGDKIEVTIVNQYRPRDSFEPRYRERGKRLLLSEDILDSNSGHSTWTIVLPKGASFEFSSASGDMEVIAFDGELGASTASGDIEFDQCSGTYDISTASGDVTAYNCKGDFELATASGDVVLRDCRGAFEASSASGDVDARDVVLADESEFNTASGDVEVILGESPRYNLEVSSASGDAVIDFNGNEIKGAFEFTARVRKGDIESPYAFDDEEVISRYSQHYDRKTFTRGDDTPFIKLGTGSGKVALKK